MYLLRRVIKAIDKRLRVLIVIREWSRYAATLKVLERSATRRDCIVICNGPSLKNIEMSSIRDVDSFCLNRSYLAFKDWGFQPKFFVCVNELVLEQFADDINRITATKFLNFSKRHLFNDDSFFIRLAFKDRVVQSFDRPLSCAATVTFVAIQLALLMGYKRIGIIGLDHSFTGPGRPNETLRAGDVDENHFLSGYFSGEVKWEYPDLEKNERGYELLNQYASESGVEIYDCTSGGKSQAFRKMSLSQFLEGVTDGK